MILLEFGKAVEYGMDCIYMMRSGYVRQMSSCDGMLCRR